jgi:hypothetical protein
MASLYNTRADKIATRHPSRTVAIKGDNTEVDLNN